MEKKNKEVEKLKRLIKCGYLDIDRTQIETINYILQENEELKVKNKILECIKTGQQLAIKELQNNIEEQTKNSISKSKIKEKIEELEKQAEEVKSHYKGTYACLDEYLNAKLKIQGYKELLEEGE